ncbi:MAG: TIGR02996 domain-containing protein [Gemmataceae bacterium]
MNEDEAFIRAIVDSPGDDTARLAYADWLDDRSDPRGTYLRAEHEWAATHDPSERDTLRQLAKTLDPVWVARISRPPVGVCCDHVRFIERGPVITLHDIAGVEQRLDGQLSVDFQAFMLNYNGCKPAPACLPYPAAAGPAWADMDLEMERFNTASEIETERAFLEELYETGGGVGPNPLIAGMVPFAYTIHDLGYLLVGIGDGNRGRVYHFRDYCHFSADPAHLFDYTNTFAEFLTRLRPERETTNLP